MNSSDASGYLLCWSIPPPPSPSPPLRSLPLSVAAGPLAATFAFGLLASVADPYGWRIYAVAHGRATQVGALNKIGELQAIPFRGLGNRGARVFGLGAAGALGWARRLAWFESGR